MVSIVSAGVDGLIQVDSFDGVDVFESISNEWFDSINFESISNRLFWLFDGLIQVHGLDGVDVFKSISISNQF